MKWRFKAVLGIYIAFFFLIFLQLINWQILKSGELKVLGQAQYGRTVLLDPRRGEIRTSDNYSLAANKLTYLVYANPKLIDSVAQSSSILAPILEEDQASISALLSLDRYWVPLKSEIDIKKKDEIKSLGIKGVDFQEQYTRFYPEASLSAQLLGFVGKDDKGNDQGYVGLEGYYDRQLRGKTIQATQIFDALNRPILSKIDDPVITDDGRNLILNIDRSVQFLVERELKDGIKKYGAEGGEIIIMNPKTGAILAMASQPTFDPRSYWESDEKLYVNPVISSTYEPGSTFKPLIMASAIDAGLVESDTKCTICSKPVEIGGYSIKTWNDKYTDNISMNDVIVHSDNTGMVFVSQKMGLDRMYKYLQKFGIGETTQIDLQGEVASPMRPKDSWYPIDVATASFGQGISVTPIQLISAFSSLANKGIRMEPQVVDKIELKNGEITDIKPKELGRTVSYKTSIIMKEILVNAVEQGESKWVKPEGYRIAGKTGTAQIPIGGKYDANKTIPSFIGFAPADDPKFIMLVVLDKPSTSIYGSETAAPIFFSIARKLLIYYGVNPTS